MVALWLGSGCGDGSPDDGTGASSVGSGDGSTAAVGSTTASSSPTSEATTTATSEAGSGEAPTTAAADSSDGPVSTGPGDTGTTCEPPPPAGDVCLECVAASCCTAWAACQADEPCACVVDCHVVQGGSLGMCSNQCNLDSELYQALYFCGQGSCLGSCEWDCC